MSSDLIVDIGNGGVLPQCLFFRIVKYFMLYIASQFYLELTDAHIPGSHYLYPQKILSPTEYDEHNKSHLMSKLTPQIFSIHHQVMIIFVNTWY